MLKSQAVGLLLKLVCIENAERKSEQVDVQQYSVRRLAEQTGISKSQVSVLLNHLLDIGLVRLDRQWHVPRVNRSALLDILRSSVRYLFSVRLGEVTLGIPTGFAAPVLQQQLISAGELIPVWPDARGSAKGQAVMPLFASVAVAIKHDAALYDLLALVDCVRLGQARERQVAVAQLEQLLGKSA